MDSCFVPMAMNAVSIRKIKRPFTPPAVDKW